MIITYHGAQHIKLVVGDTTLAYNPPLKGAGAKSIKYGANIVLSSMNLPLYSGIEECSHGTKEPFVVKGAGEYETQGIFIRGVGTEAHIDGKSYINTIYTFTFDSMNICFLGTLTSKLQAEEREAIDSPDIIFVCSSPYAGALSPYELHTLALSFEPKVIIPIGFSDTDLPLFLKEGGSEKRDYLEKLTLKRKDIEGKNAEVIPLMEI